MLHPLIFLNLLLPMRIMKLNVSHLGRMAPLICYHRVRSRLYGGSQRGHWGMRLTVHRTVSLALTGSRDAAELARRRFQWNWPRVKDMSGLFLPVSSSLEADFSKRYFPNMVNMSEMFNGFSKQNNQFQYSRTFICMKLILKNEGGHFILIIT